MSRIQRSISLMRSVGLVVLVAVGVLPAIARGASAAPGTVVSLTFDNGTVSQYTLGYQQALQPHGAHATFFVNSGNINGGSNFITWTQLTTLSSAGNDIGGKTVNATNLTTLDTQTQIAQVCNDRLALMQHGLSPMAFAYPGGAFNAAVESVVQGCGYGNGRSAGSVSPGGPTFAETIPPANWLATKAYAPSTVTLANLQTLVTNAASHGGGWDQIVIGRVCSQAQDPANYTSCSAASGHIELADLNTFLDWMQNAGQNGGAPTGASLDTVAHFVTSNDVTVPTTTIACNGTTCSSSQYPNPISVSLSVLDTGSGPASTHYTIDGSDPTQASPTYSAPFTLSTSATVKYRSWDIAGNVEPVHAQIIDINSQPQDTIPPTTSILCNGVACSGAYNISVSISLSATDNQGGSGVDKTYYTTDGSTPATSSPVYSVPFQLTQSATVKFFSTDLAGNAETVQSQAIQVIPPATRVSLTFDDNTLSQYTLGYQQALQPHGAHASFFVNSGIVESSAKFMSWAQLADLSSAGNDIGGKTVNATNLTTLDTQTQIAQVCNDRLALMQHGLSPMAFAYPGGAFNAAVESVVQGCGYGNGRSAGSVSPGGPTFAETIPPANWLATKAYAPSTVTLANLETLVTNAASHGGGWDQIVIGKVCSQALDPADYSTCSVGFGHIELADLNTFLDWIQNAGQSGGAPAGTVLSTVRDVVTAADQAAPVTTILCDGAQCSPDPYLRVVRATLSATDVGSSVASTHYTLDGSDPSLASPAYTGTSIPITSPTTIKFRSWDYAGNAEATQSQPIDATPPPDSTPPTTTASCNNTACGGTGYNGSVTVTLTAVDDAGGWGVDKTYYTTDGSTPTTSSPVYSGPFQLTTGNYNVQFFSVDLAGNAEQVESQPIVVLPPLVAVSLTFDDGLLSQYQLAYQRALAPHHMNGTFFNISGLTNVDEQHMTWSQLTSLNNGGNEIGGHTVDHDNLKTDPDFNHKVYEVCQDRQNMMDHGFYPVGMAYPEGAYDATAESIVQGCGYSYGRAAGGIDVAGDGAGPVYAETIPPKDPYATRTVFDPVGNGIQVNLAHLEASVTAAAQHGGGWIQLVFHQICSQTYDPTNYSFCISDYGPIELDTLNAFLDWLQNAGENGGAPPRTAVETVSQVINGPDTQAPATTLKCDGSACLGTTYSGSTTVSIFATDPGGSGIKATYYTTDGSTPTQSSPLYTGPFTIGDTKTISFFSVDNSGNIEAVHAQQVNVLANTDPIVGSAGDIACDPAAPAFNNGLGTDTDCRASHTVGLLTGVDAVLPLGDDQYDCGGTAAFAQSYDPTWGVKLGITHPVPGDKDYATSGGTDCPTTPGAGYYQYFGSRAGDPTKGYYSYNLGTWHVIALNTAPCGDDPTSCQAGSAQDQWLQQDLQANAGAQCTLAYYQNPRWASTNSGGDATYQQFWQDLYAGGVDVVLNGDSHWYERFQQQDASGQVDTTNGVREFIVGTGGAGLDTPGSQRPNSQALNNSTHGVMRLTLHNGSYGWAFVPDEGTFTDSGTASCHIAPDHTPPVTTIACNGLGCQSGFYSQPVDVTLSATDNVGGSGVASTHYTTNGTDPTLSSPTYTGAFTVSSTSTVKFRSWDNAGNIEVTKAQLVAVDTAAPVTTIRCNGTTCQSGFYNALLTVTLTATDTGGSGVVGTLYTTDGTDPATSGTAISYTGPFPLSQSATVRYLSIDGAGNMEATKSQSINVDFTPPVTSMLCNGAACSSGWYKASVTVSLSATDAGGSGVSSTHYTTNGTDPTLSSSTYTTPFKVNNTATVKFRSWDVVGNVEPTNTQPVRIDTSAPVTTIRCNGVTCSNGWYNTSPVTVSLPASDTGGSGVALTRYTTDGSNPVTSGTAQTYTGPFPVGQTATIKAYSTDGAGNVGATVTDQVQVDAVAPTVSMTVPSNGATVQRGTRVTLAASATDGGSGSGAPSGIAQVVFYLDGTTRLGSDTSSPYTLSWNVSKSLALGQHTLTAVAKDVAGNSTTSTTVTINVVA